MFESYTLKKISKIAKTNPLLNTKDSLNVCDNCKNKTLFKDITNGVIVCKSCGIVNSDFIIDENLPTVYENEIGKNQYNFQSLIFKPIKIPYNDLNKLTSFQRREIIRRIKLGNYSSKKETKDLKMSEIFNRIITACNLPYDVYETSMKIYQMLYKKGVLTRKKTHYIVGSLINMSCKTLNIPIRLSSIIKSMNIELQPKLQIKEGKILKTMQYIYNNIDDNTLINKNNIRPLTIKEQILAHIKNININNYLDNKTLNEVEKTSFELLRYFKLKKVIINEGSGKNNYSTGIIFIAIKLQNLPIYMETISKWLEVSVSTLRTYFKLLTKHLPEKYQNIINKRFRKKKS